MAVVRRTLLLLAIAATASGHVLDVAVDPCEPLVGDVDGSCSSDGTALIQKTVLMMPAAEKAAPQAPQPPSEAGEAPSQRAPSRRPFSGRVVEMFQRRSEDPGPKKKGSRYRLAGRKIEKSEHRQILERNGWFLGIARDAWIVFGAIVAGILVSLAVVLLFVRSAAMWRADHLKLGTEIAMNADGHIVQPKFPIGTLQTLFRYDLNSFFAYRADLAVRCALACAVCGLAYVVPALGFLNDYGWSMQYVVVIVCFSVYMDLGNTVALAWYNFYGTLLPTINVIFCYALFEQGTTGAGVRSTAWWFGVIDFAMFCGAFLVFRVPVGVRMFALSWQAYFSMCFLNPGDETRFSRGLDDIILEGAAIGPLMGTVIGCVISVLVVCSSPLGFTLTGLGRAQEKAMEVIWTEGELWKNMVSYYAGKEKLLEIESLIGHAKALEKGVEELDDLLSMTWWETFDVGRPGRVRAHLLELNKGLRLAHDWLKCILTCVAEEDFNDEHDALLEKLAPSLTALSDSISKLMYRQARMACAGFSISSVKGAEAQLLKLERQYLQADVAAVNGAQRQLAKDFVKFRKEVYGKDVITPDATGEHMFMYGISVYGNYATEYAEYLISDTRESGVSIPRAAFQGVRDTLYINSLDYISRSGLGFFGAFLIGYFGMAQGIMPAFSSTAAGTTAYLLAAEGKVGSAIMKNVARFQGTAGGTLLGQLLYATIMDSCTTVSNIFGFITIAIFEFFALYLYYSSASFGYVGLLLAAYGAQHMLLACGASEANSDEAVYMTIIDQSMAIICVSVADLVVGNASAGHMAATSLFDLTRDVRVVLDKIFKTNEQESRRMIRRHTKTIEEKAAAESTLLQALMPKPLPLDDRDSLSLTMRGKYVAALDMGNEAALEPRFYRMPFKEQFWESIASSVEGVVVRTCVMHSATHLKGQVTKAAEAVTNNVTTRPTFKKMTGELMERWSNVFFLAEQVMMNETLAKPMIPPTLTRALSDKQFLSMDDEMQKLLNEVNATIQKQDVESLSSCAAEEGCLASVIIEMTNGILKKVNSMEDACFKCNDISVETAED